MCGHSLEVNVTSDMDFCLSTNQIHLLVDIYETNIGRLVAAGTGRFCLLGK